MGATSTRSQPTRSSPRHPRMISSACGTVHDVVGEQEVVVGLDALDRIHQIERVRGDITGVVDTETVERRRPGGHVVRPEQNRLGPNVTRPVAGSWSIRGTDVERNPYDRHVELGERARAGKPHKGFGRPRNVACHSHRVDAGWSRRPPPSCGPLSCVPLSSLVIVCELRRGSSRARVWGCRRVGCPTPGTSDRPATR